MESVYIHSNCSASRLWRKLAPHFVQFRSMSLWKIGKVRYPFGALNWLGEVLNYENCSSLTVRQGLGNYDLLVNSLTPSRLQRAMTIVRDATKDDELIFMPSQNGFFQVKACLSTTRQHRTSLGWTYLVWNSILPYNNGLVRKGQWIF